MLYTLEDSDSELEELEPDFEPVERVIDGVMQVRDHVYFSDKVMQHLRTIHLLGDTSGRLKPPVDLVRTVLAAGGMAEDPKSKSA